MSSHMPLIASALAFVGGSPNIEAVLMQTSAKYYVVESMVCRILTCICRSGGSVS